MANSEALKELQSRLASRLQAARSEGVSATWLAVKAGGRNYLLPLTQSGEIYPLAHLQPVPYTRPWFMGVINIRGGLFGVVDLADFLARNGGASRLAPLGATGSVVSLNPALEVNCALRVDGLAGLRGSDAFKSSTPAQADGPEFLGGQFVDAQGESWQEINVRVLSQAPSFLGIGV